jgi:NADPH-dependent ferric siderophore reductase
VTTVPTSDAIALAERVGAIAMDLTVIANEPLGQAMRRIVVEGEPLAEMPYIAGHDVMVAVAVTDARVVRRRYTIRRLDREARTLEVDVLLHGGGPGARWASSVTSGDVVAMIGPRGKVNPVEGVAWHAFVGDDAFLPATLAMSDSLPDDVTSLVVSEIDGADDEQPTVADVVRWVHRDGSAPGQAGALVEAVNERSLPAGIGHVYLGAELRVVPALQQAFVAKGVTVEHISPKPYWRKGMANADHGEPVKS